MDNTVSAAEHRNEPTPPPHPYAATATFLRDACGGCRIDTSRSADSEK